jgi:hypothetical protein
VINIIIKAKGIFSRQMYLWINRILVLVILGTTFIFISTFELEDNSNLYILIFGLSIIVSSIVYSWKLISEIVNPEQRVLKGTLKKFKCLKLNGDYFGYRLILESDEQKKKLYIFHKEKWIESQWALNVMLKVNEIYSVKYLSKSNLITEIENISNPELNLVIEDCFTNKRVSKKGRKKAFKLLDEYNKR